MNANTIIYASLGLIGVLDPGEAPSASATTAALAALNNMLDSWSTERLNIFSLSIAAYNATSAKRTYTIGATGTPDISAPRPVKLERAIWIIPNGGGGGGSALRFPIRLIGEGDYVDIMTQGDTSPVPKVIYNDYAVPNSTLSLFPVPSFATIAPQIELSTWTALPSFPDLVTDEPLAAGYAKAIQYALAIDLAAIFAANVPQEVIAMAQESKAAIRALNVANGFIPSAPEQQTPQQAPSTNAVPAPPMPPQGR